MPRKEYGVGLPKSTQQGKTDEYNLLKTPVLIMNQLCGNMWPIKSDHPEAALSWLVQKDL